MDEGSEVDVDLSSIDTDSGTTSPSDDIIFAASASEAFPEPAVEDDFDPVKKEKKETIMERLERVAQEASLDTRVRGKANATESPGLAEERQLRLELDFALLSNPALLAEGVVLQDPMETSFGKVVFSLAHLPIGQGFQTERGTSLVRISESEVVFNGRKVLQVPGMDVSEQTEHERAMAQRREDEERAVREERRRIEELVDQRIDFRASVAQTKRSKKLIPGYRVLVEYKKDGATRTVSKRFDDFVAFHRDLQNVLPLAKQAKLPRFPRRTRMVVAGPEALEARRLALDRYLQELLMCDIVLDVEDALREFVENDGDAWMLEQDGEGTGKRRKKKKKAAVKADLVADEDALSSSEEEKPAQPAVRVVAMRTGKKVKKSVSKAKDRLAKMVGKEGEEATAVDVDIVRHVEKEGDKEGSEDGPEEDNIEGVAEVEADREDAGHFLSDDDDDVGGSNRIKVSFGGRKVKKQRKQVDTQAHVYVEVRDATGLPDKTVPYVALSIMDNDAVEGMPHVIASSFSEGVGNMRATKATKATAPTLLRMRTMVTTPGKTDVDGVNQGCEWRESFRLNCTDPEDQSLVLSLCGRNMLKDTRLASLVLPLRSVERTWFVARNRDGADAGGMTADMDAAATAAGRRVVFDGVDRWLPFAVPGHPEARVRVCLAYRSLMEISQPRQFRHKGHIGFGDDGGFNTRNLPSAWKGFFKKIGIKPKELRDPVTAKMVFDIISKHKDAVEKGEQLTAEQVLIDIDFAERPSGQAPAPPSQATMDLLDDLEGIDPFASLDILIPEKIALDVDPFVDVAVDNAEDNAANESSGDSEVVGQASDRSEEKSVDNIDGVDSDGGVVEPDDVAEHVKDVSVDSPPPPPTIAPPPPPPMPAVGTKKASSVVTPKVVVSSSKDDARTDADAFAAAKAKLTAVKPTDGLAKTKSTREQAMDSIRVGNLKESLKPASARALAPKAEKEASTLGDVLMLAMNRRRKALKVDKLKNTPAAQKGLLDSSDDDGDNSDDEDWSDDA